MIIGVWRKSKKSGPWSDNCVEVAPVWLTSSHCESNNCVQVAKNPDEVWVRHSKDKEGPVLKFTRDEWNAFVLGTRDGEFDIEGM